jgi:hypothetical protein
VGVRRHAPVDVERIAVLRAWSLRLRLAADVQAELGGTVTRACGDAGLVGPAGDALQGLGQRLADAAAASARAAGAAADELDRLAVASVVGGCLGPPGGSAARAVTPAPAGGRP